ncbi:hypothetical protein HK102_011450, partial [Quaeritorhiza haematococci]
AIAPLLEKQAPGLSMAMISASLTKTPFAALSRPICGIRKRTIIVTLPGSQRAAVENLEAILLVLPHACELVRGVPGAGEATAGDATHKMMALMGAGGVGGSASGSVPVSPPLNPQQPSSNWGMGMELPQPAPLPKQVPNVASPWSPTVPYQQQPQQAAGYYPYYTYQYPQQQQQQQQSQPSHSSSHSSESSYSSTHSHSHHHGHSHSGHGGHSGHSHGHRHHHHQGPVRHATGYTHPGAAQAVTEAIPRPLATDLNAPVAARSRKSPYPMISFEEAQRIVNSRAQPLAPRLMPVDHELVGHVLAEDAVAREAVPGYRASIVDGYAVV